MDFEYEKKDWFYVPKKFVGELARFLRFESRPSISTEGLLPLVHDPLADLYDNWYSSSWDAKKYSQYLMLKQIPGISWNMNVYEGMRDNEQYLYRHQMSWDKVKNPDRLPGTSKISMGYAGTYQMISRNLNKLYR